VNVIVNTTILSNFASVGRLDLLRSLLGPVYIATAVYAEVQEGLADGYQFYEAVTHEIQTPSAEPWLRLTAPTNEELQLKTRGACSPETKGLTSCRFARGCRPFDAGRT
jgi:predicted nucleic acid-binding protein